MSHPISGLAERPAVEQATGVPAAAEVPSLTADSERVVVLEAGRAERNYWQDLWHYRELFAILAWRDRPNGISCGLHNLGWPSGIG